MKKTVLFFMFLVIGITVFPNSIKYYEKAKIIDTVSIVKPGETEMDLIQKENMAVQIMTGKYSGKNVMVENKIYKNREQNINVKRADSVILEIDDNAGILTYKIIRHDNSFNMIIFFIIVIILAIVLFEMQGVKSIIYIILFSLMAGHIYFYLLGNGSPVILTGLVILTILMLSYIFLFKNSKKEKKIILFGTTLPFLIFLIVNSIVISKFKITGFITNDVVNSAAMFRNVDLRGAVNISIMFVLFAVLMLISILIADNLEKNSGNSDNIFRDIMKFSEKIYGALIVFVTAFVLGISYFEYLIFYTNNINLNFIMFFNSEYMVITVIRYLIIIMAILISVPLNALYGAKIYAEEEEE